MSSLKNSAALSGSQASGITQANSTDDASEWSTVGARGKSRAPLPSVRFASDGTCFKHITIGRRAKQSTRLPDGVALDVFVERFLSVATDDIVSGLPSEVLGDRTRVAQLIQNIAFHPSTGLIGRGGAAALIRTNQANGNGRNGSQIARFALASLAVFFQDLGKWVQPRSRARLDRNTFAVYKGAILHECNSGNGAPKEKLATLEAVLMHRALVFAGYASLPSQGMMRTDADKGTDPRFQGAIDKLIKCTSVDYPSLWAYICSKEVDESAPLPVASDFKQLGTPSVASVQPTPSGNGWARAAARAPVQPVTPSPPPQPTSPPPAPTKGARKGRKAKGGGKWVAFDWGAL